MRVLRRNWIVPVLLASMVGLLVMACGGHSRSLPPATPSTPTVTDGAVEGALPSGQMGTELPPTAGIPLNWHKGPSACFGELSLTAYYPEGRNPQSYLRGLRLVPRGEETGCYDLVATGDLEKRRALLFEVGYPEGLMHPVEVSFAPRYQDAAALTFTTLDAEGVLPLGVIKLDVITEPPAGESVIATVRFACGGTCHSASKVPTGPLNKVELHAGTSEGATIAWDERNCADTNNDGVVSIADITPIAAYFTQSASASAGAEMADTNKDTVVSIADLTNIAAFYGAELAGYAIYRVTATSPVDAETALAALPDSSFYDSIDRPAGVSGPPRPHYAYTDADPSPNAYYQVAPRNPSEFGVRSNTVLGAVPGPEVTITAPEDESETSEISVHVAATIDSLNAVSEVRFKVVGESEPFATLTEAPWEADLDTTEMADGSYDITVVAEDSYHQTGSDSVSITLTGHNPVVTWISPTEGEEVGNELNISLNVAALADITSVEVFVDAEADPLVTFDAAPYEDVVDASGFPGGAHTLSAIATDEYDRSGSADRGFTQLGASIEITSPSNGETIWGDDVQVTVVTDAPAGSMVDILFEDWSDPLASKSEAPYEFTIRAFDLPAGTRTLRARVEVASIVREDTVSVEIPTTFEQAVYAAGLQPSDLNFTYYGAAGDSYANAGNLRMPEYNSYWRNNHLHLPEYTESIVSDLTASDQSLDALVVWADDRYGLSSGLPSFTPTLDPDEPLAVATMSLLDALGDAYDENAIRNDASDVPLVLQREIARVLQYVEAAIPYRNDALADMTIDQKLDDYYAWAHRVLVPCAGSVDGQVVSGNFANMVRAARLVATGIDDALANMPADLSGTYDFTVDASAGSIVVNDASAHTYDDRDYLLIVDTGGNDTYNAPAGANNSSSNGISVCIDLGGSDNYAALDDPNDVDRTANPSNDNTSQQGVGRCGVGMLVDIGGGDDTYSSVRLSQGCGIYGIGVLYDDGGNDHYTAEAVSQGAGFNGIGILADLGGSDSYSMYAYGQGFGFILGLGVLYDAGAGADAYYAEPDFNPSFPEYQSPQNKQKNGSFCQGAGFGSRPSDLAGGIGLIYDGGGDDDYTGGVFSTATAYFFSTGMVYDAGGNDLYHTQWYGCAGNAHQSACILLDKGGNDSYTNLQSCGVASGHDVSIAWLVDEGGDDTYAGAGHSLGASNECGAGYFVDFDGVDSYRSPNEKLTLGRGYFSNELCAPPPPDGYGNWAMQLYRLDHYYNFGFFVDAGGDDDTYDSRFADIDTLAPGSDTEMIQVHAGNGLTWVRAGYGSGPENPPPWGTGQNDYVTNSYWANEYGTGVDCDGGTPL